MLEINTRTIPGQTTLELLKKEGWVFRRRQAGEELSTGETTARIDGIEHIVSYEGSQ